MVRKVLTATPNPTTGVATPTPVVPTATATRSPVTATPKPSATAAPATRPPVSAQAQVLGASVQPAVVGPGGPLALLVTTSGEPARIEMYLGSGAPNAPAPIQFALVQSSPGNWTGTGIAPEVDGVFHYTVGLFPRRGQRQIVDRDAWNITVESPATATPPVAQAFPDDIPLAPPFSYGNPMAAAFSAGGQLVHGSEVVSDRQPEVQPSAVEQFYVNHLPRAGWTVNGSPAANAPSFTISAQKGSGPGARVCVVQYSNSTVSIYYGTLS